MILTDRDGKASSIQEFPENLSRELSGRRGDGLFITRNNLDLHALLVSSFPNLRWRILSKEDMRGRGVRGLLASIREQAWSVVVIEDRASDMERRQDLYTAILLLARTRSRWMVASRGDALAARPLPFIRGLVQILAAVGTEVWRSAEAIVAAYWLVWRFRGSSPTGKTAPPSVTRIAMLKTQFWFDIEAGGSVSHVRGVASGMRDLGLEPRLWTTSKLGGLDGELPQTEVVPEKRPRLFEDAAMAGFNRTFLRQAGHDVAAFHPALIYQRHDIFNLCGLVLARRLGIPLVLEVNASEVWAREAWSRLFLKDLARRMERVAFRNADRLVLISEELIPTVLALGGSRDRIVINPNGVDVLRFDPDPDTAPSKQRLGLPPDVILCGFLGTFARWHGVLFLADQIPLLVAADSRLRFLFVGEGDMSPEVKRRLVDAGVQDRVMFAGLLPSKAVPSHLAACDILLSPHLPFEDGTEFFGSPTKLFEYMAAGRAIVASRLGSISRILQQGETGMLIDPGNGEALRAAILDLANRPEERMRLGRNARASAERTYTWKANVMRALEGLVSSPRDGTS